MMEDPEREKIRVSATQEGKRRKKNSRINKNGGIRFFKSFNYTCHIYSSVASQI